MVARAAGSLSLRVLVRRSWSLLVTPADDDAGRIEGRVWLAERADYPVAPYLDGTEIHEEHLVLAVIDDLGTGDDGSARGRPA